MAYDFGNKILLGSDLSSSKVLIGNGDLDVVTHDIKGVPKFVPCEYGAC